MIKHIPHIDELMFTDPSLFFELLREIQNYAMGFDYSVGINLITKIDGSPSIFFGYDVWNREFFVSTKSFLNKNPETRKICYTSEMVFNNFGHDLDLLNKMLYAFHYLKKMYDAKPYRYIFQGDVLFTEQSLRKSGNYWEFQPNLINYKVNENLSGKKFGVAVHSATFENNGPQVIMNPFVNYFKECVPELYLINCAKVNFATNDELVIALSEFITQVRPLISKPNNLVLKSFYKRYNTWLRDTKNDFSEEEIPYVAILDLFQLVKGYILKPVISENLYTEKHEGLVLYHYRLNNLYKIVNRLDFYVKNREKNGTKFQTT